MIALVLLAAFALASLVVVGTIRPSDASPARESGLIGLTSAALALGLSSTCTAAALTVPAIAVVVVIVALLTTTLCLRRRAVRTRVGPTYVVRTPGGAARASKALVGVAAVAFAVAAFVVLRLCIRKPDGEWDAYVIWNLRARLLFRAPGDPSTFAVGAHGYYPLLLPGLVATGWTLVGEGARWVSGTIALLFGAMAVGAVIAAVKPRRGPSIAILGALAVVAMPTFLHQVAWRYADVPIAAFLVLAVGWLASAYEHPARARSAVALAGLCASLAAWTKSEGLVHTVAIASVLLLRPPAGLTRPRALAFLLAGAAPFVVVLMAFKLGLAPDSAYAAAAAPAAAAARLTDGSRYATVAGRVIRELTRGSHWNFLLPAAILLVGLLPRRCAADVPVARVVGLTYLAYAAVYVLTPYPLAWQLDNSLERLLLQLVPALVVATALRVGSPPPAPTPGADPVG